MLHVDCDTTMKCHMLTKYLQIVVDDYKAIETNLT